ncbi:ankyrin repeat domain-containing protein [Intrasporangium sp.]|uniref:ankyrin repeat domain-containing protein n=1 Tax=Intrasporangium sp. TaxID=1925024 RepID=UPI002939E7B4|nr:ankyrin repeat domain-containing protein [Intrasporangium sp.]MDV3219923.1 ankyrin repeat domain-containing protein [Intrasporangium sp.]
MTGTSGGRSLTPEERRRIIDIAMELARTGQTGDLLDFLDHGVPVDMADADGNSFLMLAAYHGREETVAALIARGADVNRRNSRDQSPVAGAIFKGEDSVVRTLVAAGADLDAGSPTARQAAELFGRSYLLEGAP